LFLAREAKIPIMQRPEKITKPVLIPEISPGYVSGVIASCPIYKASNIIAIPMLSICPTILMVPTTPEAIPKCFFSTELMMALVLGEEKKPNPVPIMMSIKIISDTELFSLIKHSMISPVAVRLIPIEAMIPGLCLSDNLPAIGDKRAIITGWEIITKPAVLESRSFRY
jgi:hypothetical protein